MPENPKKENKDYVKHLIECKCFLPRFKNRENPVFHKFVVFSEIDETGKFISKNVQCPNCGLGHNVVGVGASKIYKELEDSGVILTIDDLKQCLPDKLISILEKNNVDLATFEHAKFIIDNERWGETVSLRRQILDKNVVLKILKISGEGKFSVENHKIKDIV